MTAATLRQQIQTYLNGYGVPGLNSLTRTMVTLASSALRLPNGVSQGASAYIWLESQIERVISTGGPPSVQPNGWRTIDYNVAIIFDYEVLKPSTSDDTWADGLDAMTTGLQVALRASPNLGTAGEGPYTILTSANEFPFDQQPSISVVLAEPKLVTNTGSILVHGAVVFPVREQVAPAVPSFPNAGNTGVPAGVVLGTYAGPTTFSSGTYNIDSMTINADLQITGSAQVTITRSLINGHVDAGDAAPASYLWMTDCEVNASTWNGAAVGYSHFTLERCNIHGGTTTVNVSGDNQVLDCWMHDQYLAPTSSAHNNGLLCSGNASVGAVNIQHCSISCDTHDNGSGGGPTGAVAFFGDFDLLSGITLNNSYLVAGTGANCGGYTVAGGADPGKTYPTPYNVAITNNTFTRPVIPHSGAPYGTTTDISVINGCSFGSNVYSDTGSAVVANT